MCDLMDYIGSIIFWIFWSSRGHWGHCREIAWKETHLNAKVAFFTMMWQFKVFSHCIVEVYKWWTITILDREFDNSCQCSVWRGWSHRWWYASSNIYYHNKLGWARARNHRLSQLSNIPDKYIHCDHINCYKKVVNFQRQNCIILTSMDL